MEGTETILVVEDAEPIRKVVCTILSQLGYACIEAADGTAALGLIRENPAVNLVITDLVMPHMGGAQLARHLAVERPDIRIVLMSGYSDDPVEEGLDHEPAYFLAKPFTSAALTGTVREALTRPWNGLPDDSARALGSGTT